LPAQGRAITIGFNESFKSS